MYYGTVLMTLWLVLSLFVLQARRLWRSLLLKLPTISSSQLPWLLLYPSNLHPKLTDNIPAALYHAGGVNWLSLPVVYMGGQSI